MRPFIDLQGVTPAHLQSTDKPVLTAAVAKAVAPTRPSIRGAGFENKL